jgi:hypothetical protein
VNENKNKASSMTETVTKLVSFHLAKHHFLTISTIGWKEKNLPTTQRARADEIESTIDSRSKSSRPDALQVTVCRSLDFLGLEELMTV